LWLAFLFGGVARFPGGRWHLKAARELLGEISSEGEARVLARMPVKSAIDYAWSIAAATDQGRAKGEAKGKGEGEAKGKA